MILQFFKVILIIFGVLAIFNLMIIVHELGHFLAARWRGLVIEKFGIWFGKPLWKKTINGVEYSLGSIPAGGFVALPQLAPMEVMEGKVETPRDQLPPITALDKIIVAFAGPLFSFSLAVVFACIVWFVGRPMSQAESTQIIGALVDDGPAQKAGLLVGDKIVNVDGHNVSRFAGMSADSIQWSVVRSEGESIAVTVEREVNGKTEKLTKTVFPKIPEKANWYNRGNLRNIGVGPSTDSMVAEITPDSAAAKAGLQKGDIITTIDDQKLYSPDTINDYVKDHPKGPYRLTVKRDEKVLPQPLVFEPLGIKVVSVGDETPASRAKLQDGDIIDQMDGQPARDVLQVIDYVGKHAGVPITLDIRRGPPAPKGFAKWVKSLRNLFGSPAPAEPIVYTKLTIQVTPLKPISNDPDLASKGKIGAVLASTDGVAFEGAGSYGDPMHPTPIEQVRMSVAAIVNTLDAVFSRKSSIGVQQMGGPVMMMNAYYHMLSSPKGIQMAIWFSVVLNVNLAILNLLPIPVLDGGHITLAIIESIRRRPINVRILEYVQTACALVIISFMLFIMFFDVQDLPFMGSKRVSMRFPKSADEVQK